MLCQFIRALNKPTQLICCRTIATTNVVNAEPPRKKRRIDPALLRLRVEKKLKKTEREIAKMESEPRQLIPINEYQLSNSEIRELKARPGRTLADVGITLSSVKAAERLWNFYRKEQYIKEKRSIRKVERSQTHALNTLKQIDDALYQSTVAVDELTLIPYASSHVRKETAANPDYTPPDGHIKDASKEWIM